MESIYSEATPFDEHFMMDGYGYGAPSLYSEEARARDARRTLGAAADLNMSTYLPIESDENVLTTEIRTVDQGGGSPHGHGDGGWHQVWWRCSRSMETEAGKKWGSIGRHTRRGTYPCWSIGGRTQAAASATWPTCSASVGR
jgi:hypothetical protein